MDQFDVRVILVKIELPKPLAKWICLHAIARCACVDIDYVFESFATWPETPWPMNVTVQINNWSVQMGRFAQQVTDGVGITKFMARSLVNIRWHAQCRVVTHDDQSLIDRH